MPDDETMLSFLGQEAMMSRSARVTGISMFGCLLMFLIGCSGGGGAKSGQLVDPSASYVNK